MHFLRKSVVWLAIAALPFILFTLATTFVLQRTIGNPETVKGTLRDSGIYASAVDIFLKETDNPNDSGQEGIKVDDPVVQDAFKKAFTPGFLQTSVEDFVDGWYAWMEGNTSKNEFKIDLTGPKATLIDEISKGAEARAATLPPCPRGQTQFDNPFSATCLPRGVPASAAGEKIRQEFASSEFLKNPIITADSIKTKSASDSQGPSNSTTVGNKSVLPENYQRFKKAPVILTILAAMLSLAVIFLSGSIRKGLKRVGMTLLIVGLTLLVLSWVSTKVINSQLVPNIKLDNSVLQDKLRTVASDLSTTFGSNFMAFGGVYAALGAAAVAGTIFINRREGSGPGPAANSPTNEPQESKLTAKQAPEEPAPKPRPKKIQ